MRLPSRSHPPGECSSSGADPRRRADRLVDRRGGAVVDAARERDDAAVVAQRHLEGLSVGCLALGDRPMLLEVGAHLGRARAPSPTVPMAERKQGEQRPDDLRAVEEAAQRRHRRAEHRPEPHRHDQRLEAQHARPRPSASSRGRRARGTPRRRRRRGPSRAGRCAASRSGRAEYSPTRWRQRNPARASGRALPARLARRARHIRSISEVVTDQWVVTSP